MVDGTSKIAVTRFLPIDPIHVQDYPSHLQYKTMPISRLLEELTRLCLDACSAILHLVSQG